MAKGSEKAMAIYHCSIRVGSRGGGRSSIQMSAYISGEKERDEMLDITYDHTTKEEVTHQAMLFAERVPEEWREKERFWNEVERVEQRADAQLYREFEIALPHELDREERQRLAEDIAKSFIEKDKMPAVQFGVHEKEGNAHVHILTPMRDITDDGKWENKRHKEYTRDEEGNKVPKLDTKKVEAWEKEHGRTFDYKREADEELKKVQKLGDRNRRMWEQKELPCKNWNSKELAEEWRERVATCINKELERKGLEERVDHRSYERQGLERVPMIHEGRVPEKAQERHEVNLQIQAFNKNLEQERQYNILSMQMLKEMKELAERKAKELLEGLRREYGAKRVAERMQNALRELRRERQSVDHSRSERERNNISLERVQKGIRERDESRKEIQELHFGSRARERELASEVNGIGNEISRAIKDEQRRRELTESRSRELETIGRKLAAEKGLGLERELRQEPEIELRRREEPDQELEREPSYYHELSR